MRQKGFTLMELLIVIGVLGILAAGLLAAIDPFEQLKKARDANNRNAGIETVNAFTRYYATHGSFPWNQTVSPADCDPTTDVPDLAGGETVLSDAANIQDCIISSLITSDGELKTTFFDGLRTTLYLTSAGPTSMQVCFNPESKAQRNDLVATTYYYDSTAGTVTKQTRDGSTTTCDTDLDNCLQCFQ